MRKTVYTGREQIFIPEVKVNTENIRNIVAKCKSMMEKNGVAMKYLWNYYKGDQPINDRVKDIRPEITNKIVENHANEIVEFKKGYIFGDPVMYVQNGKQGIATGYDEPSKVSPLNEYMSEDNKPAKDVDLSEYMFVCGTAYRMALPTEEGEELPFETDVLVPWDTFVAYDTGFGKKPWLCGYRVRKVVDDKEIEVIVAYTKNRRYDIYADENKTINEFPNVLGELPIIEYPLNQMRLGSFEIVLDLLDALNTIASNRVDGIEQFVQHLVKFINCEIDTKTYQELRKEGAIQIKSTNNLPADVEIMSQEMNQSQVQTLVDYIYQTILTITGVPDRKASAGGNTGQALIIGQGWQNAEARAKSVEKIFSISEKRFLKLIMKILKNTSGVDEEVKSLKLSEIDIKFTRNKTDNLQTKTQGLQNLLEAGIHPRIAIATVGLFSDPEQVFADSQEYLKKWLQTITTGNTSPDQADPQANAVVVV